MSKRAKEKAERIANGIMISVQGKTGRVVYNTKEKSFTHYELMCAAQKGYEQAEKDLALTWEDMKQIAMISVELSRKRFENFYVHQTISDEEHFSEVLKRFNEQRKK